MIMLDPRPLPGLKLQVLEPGQSAKVGWEGCELDREIRFSSASLESYLFAGWEETVFDALVVAAAVEFCDRRRRRPAYGWGREFQLRISVHNPDRWNAKPVRTALIAALSFLTGDIWQIEFSKRKVSKEPVRQRSLPLPSRMRAVIPFSKGMDSRAVAGLVSEACGSELVRVRVGSEVRDKFVGVKKQPFTSIPYEVTARGRSFPETSARSRGFKFALVSAIAAYLADVEEIILPESGQGALGPALIPVGQAYEDYRNHPLFMRRMETLIAALFDHRVRYSFPRLWFTKAETLRAFVTECADGETWAQTWSCWQQSRHASVDKKQRQCGICAACMLRRLSVHAAGLHEPAERYVWETLESLTFEAGAAEGFPQRRITRAMREYAIAGALHMEHLGDLRSGEVNARILSRAAFQVGRAEGIESVDALNRMRRLIEQHAAEWGSFREELGPQSFVQQWLRAA